MATSDDTSNLPAFFQTSRSNMMTVLDGLGALEDGVNTALEDDDLLEGCLEDEAIEECDIEELRNNEEVYVDNDDDFFNSLTSAGLPEQFDFMSGKEESLNSLVSEMRVGEAQKLAKAQALQVQETSEAPAKETMPDDSTHPNLSQQLLQPPPPLVMPPMPAPVPAPAPVSLQPPIPISQPVTYANIRNLKNIRPAKYMSTYDLKFVISRILHPLDTEDPYADDYYYIQSQIKKNKKLQAEAAEKAAEQAKQMQLGRDMPVHTPDFPPDLIVPLPTWKDAKEKMKLKVINSKRNILNRSKKWTLKEKTLGVQTRADMKTPKMQLDVQPIKDIWSGEDKSKDGEGGPLTSSSSQPIHAFHSQLWSVRMAASRCYESFYIVEELDQLLKYHQHLLNTKAHAFHMHMSSFAMAAARSNVPPQQHEIHVQQQRMQFEKEQLMINHIIGEISKERDNAITVLALSCGITPAEDNTNTGNTGLKVDEELFSALISTIKGKKLIISMFGYLLPAHKWAILPLVLIKILQRIETSNALNTSVDLEIEMRLLNQYVDFVQYAQKFQQNLEVQHQHYLAGFHQNLHLAKHNNQILPDSSNFTMPPSHAPFTTTLLSYILHAMTTIVDTYRVKPNDSGAASDRNKLRVALLSNQYRSSLLNTLIVIADEVHDVLMTQPPVTGGILELVKGTPLVEPGMDAKPNPSDMANRVSCNQWISIRDEFMNMLDE